MKVPVLESFTVEPKKAAQCFMNQNQTPGSAKHNFLYMADLLEGNEDQYCSTHKRCCKVDPGPAQLWISGFPCAPFSLQRGDKGKKRVRGLDT